jgi:integrase
MSVGCWDCLHALQTPGTPPKAVCRFAPLPAVPASQGPRVPLDEALRGYFDSIRTDNAARHVENKISMLRRFLGGKRAEQFARAEDSAAQVRRLKNAHAPFFKGTFVDEITSSLLQDFFAHLDVSTKTKRHYREFFHHFFERCIKFGLHRPENFHCPNPVAALPTCLSRNRRIEFMDQDQIDEELRLLEPHPAIRAAVAIMIHAGLRRAETLWLTRDSISPDLSFLSVVNRVDHETDIESSLKTGERAVTILPPLKRILEEYLASLRGRWLLPSSTGNRRNGDAFGKRLHGINVRAGQKWTCLHFRQDCSRLATFARRSSRSTVHIESSVKSVSASFISSIIAKPPPLLLDLWS